MRTPPHSGPSRRAFVGTALAAPLSLAAAPPSGATEAPRAAAQPPVQRAGPDQALRRRSSELRAALGHRLADTPFPGHPDNGDEARYPNKIGTDTRAIPHNERGEADPQAYALLTRAYQTGAWEDFERIPLGGTRRFLNPVGSFAVSLTGATAPHYAIPPAPALASAERAAEAVELYWQSLLRDVPLHEFQDDTGHPGLRAAADELNRLPGFNGPKRDGRVTPGTLFRGNVRYVDRADASGRTARWATPPGVLDGPVVSQFLLHDAPYGSQLISARIRPAAQVNDHLTEYAEWLRVQNGVAPSRSVTYENTPRFVSTGRDLATYAHFLPASSWAALLLLSTPASLGGLFPASQNTLAPSNPYRGSRTQAAGSSTFGAPYFQRLVATAASDAIRIAYWQKYRVHRTLRPEAYAGLVHHRAVNNVADYPVHEAVLGSQALEASRAKFGSHLLAHVYPEGAPIHTSYPGGAAIIGAVGATLLKAFFDESLVIPNPVQPDPADPTRLIAYNGPPLTVGGELNKLAVNYGIGRQWAGIHWRSDSAASLALAEELAISLLRDERATFAEPFDGFAFTRFDGTRVTI